MSDDNGGDGATNAKIEVGQTQSWPVQRPTNYAYLIADNIAIATTANSQVEVSAITVHNRFQTQNLEVARIDGEVAEISAGTIIGGPQLVEHGAIRMTPLIALGLVEAMARHLIKFKLFTEAEIREKIDAGLSE